MSELPVPSRVSSLIRCLTERAALRLVAACALAGAALGLSACAEDVPSRAHVDEVLKGLNRSHGLGPVGISPDGNWLAYVQRAKDGSELVVAPISDATKTT